MIIPWGDDKYVAPDYKKYKAEKFEKTKQKILMILKGIDQTSLKENDKKKLIDDIKAIVANL